VALLSHSNFGSYDSASAQKMREALALISATRAAAGIDGEMQADTALDARASGNACSPAPPSPAAPTCSSFPNLDAANIAYNLVRAMTDGVALGPILMGVAKPAHVLTPAATVRRVVNMTAIAAVEAQIRATRPAETGN
jgi:malate dehydrogenase (oxaloacetate-decarboxylating)(NADP+)